MSEPISLAAGLAAHLARIDYEAVSAVGKRTALQALVDTVGVTLAGSAEPAVTLLRETLFDQPPQGPALFFGSRQRGSVLDAALLNGTAAHVLDYDDMAQAMGGHPSAPVVPVVLALGESLGASGRRVLEAYVVGFEAEGRLGRVVHPHHYERGWHPTSTLGVFGAAAAAARLLGLDVERTTVALGIAASMASGVKANFGTMVKSLHVGHCARDGLMAALLAQRGYTSNPSAFEHHQGFLAAYDSLDQVRPERLLEARGLEIEDTAFGLKQFPCCGSTHPAVMAMLDLVAAEPVAARDVEAIAIRTHRRRLGHTDNPLPTSPLGAKFSIQYATVRALLDGAPRLHHFEGDSYLESEARHLLALTTARGYDEEGSGSLDDEMTADVTVTLRDGRRLARRVAGSLGRGPSNPMTDAELWTKFGDCATRVMPEARAKQAFEALNDIERSDNVATIARLLETL